MEVQNSDRLRIQLSDEYWLLSDVYNFIICTRNPGYDKSKKGSREFTPIYYTQTIKGALECLMNHKIKNTQAGSLAELVLKMTAFTNEVQSNFDRAFAVVTRPAHTTAILGK